MKNLLALAAVAVNAFRASRDATIKSIVDQRAVILQAAPALVIEVLAVYESSGLKAAVDEYQKDIGYAELGKGLVHDIKSALGVEQPKDEAAPAPASTANGAAEAPMAGFDC